MTATEVALALGRLARQLDDARTELDEWDEEATRARAAYEVAEARAYMAAKGSIPERERQALLAVEEESLAVALADLKVRKGKRLMTVLDKRISVGQSHGAAVRSEVSLSQSMPNVPPGRAA
jgi:hypothetical protein